MNVADMVGLNPELFPMLWIPVVRALLVFYVAKIHGVEFTPQNTGHLKVIQWRCLQALESLRRWNLSQATCNWWVELNEIRELDIVALHPPYSYSRERVAPLVPKDDGLFLHLIDNSCDEFAKASSQP